uniref:Uncharacterized protein n=1 Tax=Magallana gigas TaxID=29159 RepID=K1R6D0_MAGGI
MMDKKVLIIMLCVSRDKQLMRWLCSGEKYEKKDCDIANITTCDESEESSGDEVPLGKRIPKKKSFGTEFATGSTLETDSSKTSCNNPVLPAPPQPPKRSSSKTQKSSGVANQRKAPQRISSSKSPSPARSSRSRGNSRRQSFSQLSRYRSRSRENRFGQYSSSRENNRRQCSNSSRNSHRKTLSQMSRSRSRENSHRPSSRSRENSRHRTTSQLSRSTSSSAYPMSEETSPVFLGYSRQFVCPALLLVRFRFCEHGRLCGRCIGAMILRIDKSSLNDVEVILKEGGVSQHFISINTLVGDVKIV